MEWTDSQVAAVCDQVEALRERSSIEPLPGGLTNHNVLVTTPRGRYVLRLDQAEADLLGIDRDEEAANARAAEAAGVGPPCIDYRPDLGALVVGYIEADTLDNASFQADGALVPRVARACRQLHAGPRFVSDSLMRDRQRDYLARLRHHGYAYPAGYDDQLDHFDSACRALARHPEPTRPCNNDSLAENFLDDGEKIWIIDYEYASNNEPSFELGNVSTECDLTAEQITALTLAYYDLDESSAAARAAVSRVRVQAAVSAFGWAPWGYLQAATSPVDFDYTGWGDERLEKARRAFSDPGYAALLDEVAGSPAPRFPVPTAAEDAS